MRFSLRVNILKVEAAPSVDPAVPTPIVQLLSVS